MAPKKRTSDYDTTDGFVENDDAPPSKRSKINTTKSATKAAVTSTGADADEDGNPFWTLNEKGTRRVTINEFKGKWMINVREMYEKDGKMLPGKKGISMPLEQYEALIGAMPGIEKALVEKGQSVGRPKYDKANEGGSDVVEKEEEEEGPDASEEES